VLPCVGRGLCDGLITRPEKSYRVFNCMCDHRNLEKGPYVPVGNKRKMIALLHMNTFTFCFYFCKELIIMSYLYLNRCALCGLRYSCCINPCLTFIFVQPSQIKILSRSNVSGWMLPALCSNRIPFQEACCRYKPITEAASWFVLLYTCVGLPWRKMLNQNGSCFVRRIFVSSWDLRVGHTSRQD
jgi:hypothetical protein